MDIENLRSHIRDIPDFPKEGILFRDITPLLRHPQALTAASRHLAAPFKESGIDLVLGMESRGFLFGTPVAAELEAGFVPVRKPGKLPAPVHSESYSLEYGEDRLEIHVDAVAPGQRVLIVDDLIATGGTAAATMELVAKAGGEVVGLAFVIELLGLEGRLKLHEKSRVHSLLTY